MLERFFLMPKTLDRIGRSWLGPSIELCVTALCEQGYSARSIYRRVPMLLQFGAFAEAQGIHCLDEAERAIEPFLADWLARRRNRSDKRQREDRNLCRPLLNGFFCIVARHSRYHRFRAEVAEPFEASAPGFSAYLQNERGLRPGTLEHYRHALRRFEAYLVKVGCTDLQMLSLPVLTGFITTSAQVCQHRAMTTLASALRVFVRYLKREGITERDFSKSVETPQHYRLAEIPRSIGWDAVQKMLDQVDRRTAVGRRDYAMLLLMATYGLRAREVAALTLDDIDWKRDRLHVRERKADHTTAYPLAPAIGEAIVDYLKNGRPGVESRELFWRHPAPQAPLTYVTVSTCAGKYLRKAGIPVSRPGSHTLRHACVQRLVDEGFPLKTIGDYVGHRAASSTMIYAKVQVDGLREVALGDGEDLK